MGSCSRKTKSQECDLLQMPFGKGLVGDMVETRPGLYLSNMHSLQSYVLVLSGIYIYINIRGYICIFFWRKITIFPYQAIIPMTIFVVFQVFGCLFYMYYIFERLCAPLFRNIKQEPFSARVLVLCVFNSILPGNMGTG